MELVSGSRAMGGAITIGGGLGRLLAWMVLLAGQAHPHPVEPVQIEPTWTIGGTGPVRAAKRRDTKPKPKPKARKKTKLGRRDTRRRRNR